MPTPLPKGRELLQLVELGVPYRDIAAYHNTSENAVRARVSEERRRKYSGETTTEVLKDIEILEHVIETHRAYSHRISVMHFADIHFPRQDDRALDVTYQLAKAVEPAVAAVGSDQSDFSFLSKFLKDWDEEDMTSDTLDEFQFQHDRHIDRIKEASPSTLLFYLLGNHEKRLYDYILEHAPSLRKTIWRRFVEIIRSKGRVLWLGETDEVKIGCSLLIQHGNTATSNAANKLLLDVGYQINVMAGHVHRITNAFKQGEEYAVNAVTSGCLCQLKQPYQKRKRPTTKPQNGTAIADVNLRGKDVYFSNLLYLHEEDAVTTRFERKTYSS